MTAAAIYADLAELVSPIKKPEPSNSDVSIPRAKMTCSISRKWRKMMPGIAPKAEVGTDL